MEEYDVVLDGVKVDVIQATSIDDAIDEMIEFFPERAEIWKDGELIELGPPINFTNHNHNKRS